MKFKAYVWEGLGDYTHILIMDKSFFIDKPIRKENSKSKFLNPSDNKVYLFINTERKTKAIPPCLAFIMGGQYNESPPIKNVVDLDINLNEYKLEKFID